MTARLTLATAVTSLLGAYLGVRSLVSAVGSAEPMTSIVFAATGAVVVALQVLYIVSGRSSLGFILLGSAIINATILTGGMPWSGEPRAPTPVPGVPDIVLPVLLLGSSVMVIRDSGLGRPQALDRLPPGSMSTLRPNRLIEYVGLGAGTLLITLLLGWLAAAVSGGSGWEGLPTQLILPPLLAAGLLALGRGFQWVYGIYSRSTRGPGEWLRAVVVSAAGSGSLYGEDQSWSTPEGVTERTISRESAKVRRLQLKETSFQNMLRKAHPIAYIPVALFLIVPFLPEILKIPAVADFVGTILPGGVKSVLERVEKVISDGQFIFDSRLKDLGRILGEIRL